MKRRTFLAATSGFVPLSGSGFMHTASSTSTDHPTPWDTTTDVSSTHLQHPDPFIPGELHVHTINVGHGDAILLVTPDNTRVLIDTGHYNDAGEYVLSYLDAIDITRIDHLVATHGHWDHIGGHPEVIDEYETHREGIGTLLENGTPYESTPYDRYASARRDADISVHSARSGDALEWDPELSVTVLNPETTTGAAEFNNTCLTIHVEYKQTSLLLSGDAERKAEQRMVDAHGESLSADVYHAGHHGDNDSSTQQYLDRIDPEITVFSSFYDSEWDYPHSGTLDRVAELSSAAYWTGVHGTTALISNGLRWRAKPQRRAPTDPRELHEQPEVPLPPSAGVVPHADYESNVFRSSVQQ